MIFLFSGILFKIINLLPKFCCLVAENSSLQMKPSMLQIRRLNTIILHILQNFNMSLDNLLLTSMVQSVEQLLLVLLRS